MTVNVVIFYNIYSFEAILAEKGPTKNPIKCFTQYQMYLLPLNIEIALVCCERRRVFRSWFYYVQFSFQA